MPLFCLLDMTFTIRNEQLAQLSDIDPNYPALNLFIPGLFDLVTWAVQTAIATWIGTKIFGDISKE